MVDVERVREAMEGAFGRHIEDGTVDVLAEGDHVRLDGGNWDLGVAQDGRVFTDLPMNDPNYYDDDTDAFLDNVLGTEVYESLALLDARLDGALIRGLLDSGESWSARLGSVSGRSRWDASAEARRGVAPSAVAPRRLNRHNSELTATRNGGVVEQRGRASVIQEGEVMAAWKPVKVTIRQGDSEIDAMGVFDAHTLGERWNGWITPYFTREEGQRVAAWADAMRRLYPPDAVETVRWDDTLPAFVVESPDYPHEPGEPIPDEVLVLAVAADELGVDLYPIGAYRWTWEAATP